MQWPNRIIYPLDWYPLENEIHQSKTEEFISALESFVGVNRTPVSFSEEWSRSSPEDLREKLLVEYLRGASYHLITSLVSLG
jgi:hypothetical protein